MSVITLREITAATVRVICALETREEQKPFVAPNALSIAQAYFEPRAIFRAVYADEVPVGFVIWKPTDETEVAYLWRFMIDHNHQKMGHAKQAIAQLIDLLRADLAPSSAANDLERMTLCGHIEIKKDRKGRDEKHCGSTTEVLLSP
jgi:ribosomal protein S18 acetylase RimI-like enzyme